MTRRLLGAVALISLLAACSGSHGASKPVAVPTPTAAADAVVLRDYATTIDGVSSHVDAISEELRSCVTATAVRRRLPRSGHSDAAATGDQSTGVRDGEGRADHQGHRTFDVGALGRHWAPASGRAGARPRSGRRCVGVRRTSRTSARGSAHQRALRARGPAVDQLGVSADAGAGLRVEQMLDRVAQRDRGDLPHLPGDVPDRAPPVASSATTATTATSSAHPAGGRSLTASSVD
jgi:hypothetical protein